VPAQSPHCDSDALSLAITIAVPLAADRVRRSSPVILRRFGDAEAKVPSTSPMPSASSTVPPPGPSKVLADYLSSNLVSKFDWSKGQDRSDDRDALLGRIAELEALFDSSVQRETVLTNKVESVRDLLECSICFMPLCWPVSLRCSHTFCSACVAKWEMSAASSSKPLTCPTCRALAGAPTPARALNDVCRVLEDEETAVRRKEDMGVHAKYEASLRARARMDVRPRDAMEHSIPSTHRQEAQAALSTLGLARSTAAAANLHSDIAMRTGRASRTPSPPTVNVRVEGPDGAFDRPSNSQLQVSLSNAANVQAEDRVRVHTPRGRANRMTHSNFLEAERS